MLKVLLKKQLSESVHGFVYNKKGKKRTPTELFGFLLLFLLVFASVGSIFYFFGEALCPIFLSMGMDATYFTFMGTLATAVGVIGSIFTAKTELYEAKDNDLLLSMPIPAWQILFVRMVRLYCFALLFVSVVFLPAIIVYFLTAGFSVAVLLCALLALLISPFGILAICCILGWGLAVIAAKLPAKKFFTTLFSLAFIVLYMIVYSKMNDYITYIVENGEQAVDNLTKLQAVYPLWKLGQACAGNLGALAVFALMFLGFFALVYFFLSLTYIRLVTANRGAKKAKYKSKQGKQGSPFGALLRKELSRYLNNPMVALNCFLGSLFLVVAPFLPLFMAELQELAYIEGIDEFLAMFIAALLCFVCSMNMLAGASVSLEGESLWVIRSLPVATEKVLFAKAGLHVLITGIPAIFAAVFMSIYFRIRIWFALLLLLTVLAFVLFVGLLGLTINLKMPNLHWQNEVAAVKQSASSLVSLLAEWGAVGALVGGYFLFGQYLFAGGYMLVCIALLVGISGFLGWWIERRGTQIFEEL